MAVANLEVEREGPPPRENLIRGTFAFELRSQSQPASGFLGKTMTGHFSVFHEWAEVDSRWEGHFMERMAPGSFRKTIAESRPRFRVLFNHGQDPTVGKMVLGPIEELREEDHGVYYEVPLLDTSYNRDLMPGLEQGLYGASFRFNVAKDAFNRRAARSPWNPEGLPERTVTEAVLKEFGPVTWPVYSGATAGVRSLTDEFIVVRFRGADQGEEMADRADNPQEPYGDVEYADPGYQSDKKKRYPVDTKEHVHAAWSYINHEHNASMYTSEQLAHIKSVIKAAAKKFGIEISSDGSGDGDRSQDVDLERNADGSLLSGIEREPVSSPVASRSKPPAESSPEPLVVFKNPARNPA